MISSYNEVTTRRNTIEQDIAMCAAAGFKTMEVRKEKMIKYLRAGHTVEELKALLDQYGIRPVCINALQGTYMRTPQDKAGLQNACDFLCYCARILGVTKLEYIAPFAVPIEDPQELEDYTVESLKMLSDVARPYGVKIAMEYMALPTNSVKTFNEAIRIVDKVDRDNVGLLLDTWHHYCWGSTPEDILKASNGQIVMVHISDAPKKEIGTYERPECIWPGQGVIPVTEVLVNLKKIGYEEEVSIEVFDPALKELAPETVIGIAKEHVDEAIRKAEEAIH